MIPLPEGIHKHQFVATSSVVFPIINLAKHEQQAFSSFCFSRGICQYNWNIFHLTCIILVLTRSIVAPLMSARGASLVAKNGVSLSKTISLDIRSPSNTCNSSHQGIREGFHRSRLAKRPQHPLFQATQKCQKQGSQSIQKFSSGARQGRFYCNLLGQIGTHCGTSLFHVSVHCKRRTKTVWLRYHSTPVFEFG